jgi:hypothetical protein
VLSIGNVALCYNGAWRAVGTFVRSRFAMLMCAREVLRSCWACSRLSICAVCFPRSGGMHERRRLSQEGPIFGHVLETCLDDMRQTARDEDLHDDQQCSLQTGSNPLIEGLTSQRRNMCAPLSSPQDAGSTIFSCCSLSAPQAAARAGLPG